MKSRRCNRHRSNGFTLMEVMVALVIVSLGMLGVIQAVSQAASNTSYLRDKTFAHWIAMNRITELRLQAAPPELGESSGDIEMAERQWHWKTTVSKTAVASMSRIDVSVGFKEDENSSLASVTGFYGTAIAAPNSASISWQTVVPIEQPPGTPTTPSTTTPPSNTPAPQVPPTLTEQPGGTP